jgi:hypothetical protein
MTNLTWFQYDIDVWHQRMEELGLSAEEEGVLMRLFRRAWSQPIPCTLLDNHDEFAKVLGARWRRSLPLIYRMFKPAADHPGRLACEWLSAIYNRGRDKHESYVKRGKQGGRPKKVRKLEVVKDKPAKKAQLPDSKSSASVPLAHESSAEGFSSTAAKPPAPGVAHDGAAPAGAELPPQKRRSAAHAAIEARVHEYARQQPLAAAELESEVRQELSEERRRPLTRDDDFRVLERMVTKIELIKLDGRDRAIGDA